MTKLWRRFLLWGPSAKTAIAIIVISSLVTIVSLFAAISILNNSEPNEQEDSSAVEEEDTNEGEPSETHSLSGFVANINTNSAKLYAETSMNKSDLVNYACISEQGETVEEGTLSSPFAQLSSLKPGTNYECTISNELDTVNIAFSTPFVFDSNVDTIEDLSVAFAGRPNPVLRATWSESKRNVEDSNVGYMLLNEDGKPVAMGQVSHDSLELSRVLPRQLLDADEYAIQLWRAVDAIETEDRLIQAYSLMREDGNWSVAEAQDVSPSNLDILTGSIDIEAPPVSYNIDSEEVLTITKANRGVLFTSSKGLLGSWAWINASNLDSLSLSEYIWSEFSFIRYADSRSNSLEIGPLSELGKFQPDWEIVSPEYSWNEEGILDLSWKLHPTSNVTYQWEDINEGSFIVGITNVLTGYQITRVTGLDAEISINNLKSKGLYEVSISFATMDPTVLATVAPAQFLILGDESASKTKSIPYSVKGEGNDFTINWEHPENSSGDVIYILEIRELESNTLQRHFIENPTIGGNSFTVRDLNAASVEFRMAPVEQGQPMFIEPFSELKIVEDSVQVIPVKKINVSRLAIIDIQVRWDTSNTGEEVFYQAQILKEGTWKELETTESNQLTFTLDEGVEVFDIRVRARTDSYISEFTGQRCLINDTFFCEATQ
jgi:hypothetical protein